MQSRHHEMHPFRFAFQIGTASADELLAGGAAEDAEFDVIHT